MLPTETLAAELWRGDMPRSALATVQTYIYQLRKLLARGGGEKDAEILMTRPPGYMIRLQREQLDVLRFEDLVAAGRAALEADDPARAAGVLREALGMWRGAALADVDPGPRLSASIAWLEETRLSALELRIQADLRLGKYRELIGELRSLTALHPLNEWFHQQLMMALQAAGRRMDALAVYQNVRRIMREEVGLEPSQELQQTQQAILADVPVGALARF